MRKIKALLVAGAMVATMSATAFAGNVTTTLTGDDVKIDNGNFVVDLNAAGIDPTTFTSCTFTVTCDAMADGAGGGIMMNSTSLGWKQDDDNWSWAQEKLADKTSNFVAEATGNENEYTITFEPGVSFAAEDKADAEGYAQVVLQQWWGSDIVVTGYEINKGAAAEEPAPAEEPASEDASSAEPAPATDTTPKTGDATSVAVLAVVALLAMGGVVVTSKKRA